MKNLIKTILVIFLVFASINSFAQTFNGDLTINTQDQINTFNYTTIDGLLTIEESTSGAITNLNGLSSLTAVTGGVLINNNINLSTLRLK